MGTLVFAGGCDLATVSPSPSESPPGVPLMRFQTTTTAQFDGRRWTFFAQVRPNGSPTDVVLEVGTGTPEAATFDQVLPAHEDLLDTKTFDFKVELPDEPFCVRFTATNAVGTTSTPPHCPAAFRLTFPPASPSSP
jgi:hypothetical protein